MLKLNKEVVNMPSNQEYLNTSHVKVKHIARQQWATYGEFKYISC